MSCELSRVLPTDRIGVAGLTYVVEADETERAALALRLAIPGITALRCAFTLRPGRDTTIDAEGRLSARVVRTCVVSLDEFEAPVEETFTVRFVPAGTESDDPDPQSVDEIPYANGAVDLGEAVAEQLALSLDPYPRKPDAALSPIESDSAAQPFARLASLRRND